LNVQDEQGRTPLHWAVEQNQQQSCVLLLELGADPNILNNAMMGPLHLAVTKRYNHLVEVLFQSCDKTDANLEGDLGNTPVMMACCTNNCQAIQFLFKHGAKMCIQNKLGHYAIHTVAFAGAKEAMEMVLEIGKATLFDHVELAEYLISKCNAVKEMLSDEDVEGCTPLHYACKLGIHDSVKNMLGLNIFVGQKSREKKSALHFAAEYGRINTCKRLLETLTDSKMLNDWDEKGLTPLHLASRAGHTQVVELLLRSGALFQSDYKGWSCLHHAVAEGYTQTIKILLSANVKLLDETNEDGNTALHIAAQVGHVGAVLLLLERGAEITLNNADNSFLHEAVRNERKDVVNAIIENERSLMDFQVASAFLYSAEETYAKTDKSMKYQTFGSYECIAMVRCNRLELLTHPVSRKYLEMKWKAYGSKVHLLNLAVYLLGLLPLTYLILNLRPKQDVFGNSTSVIMVPVSFREQKSLISVCIIMVLVLNVYSVCKELVQLAQQQVNYFTDFSNLADWCAAISSLVFVIPMCFNLENTWQWEAGAFAILTSWIGFLLYFQRFERIGIYVVMFGGIVRTLVCIMILFIFLLLAFGLAFYALMLHQDEFSSISLALAQTFVMTVGELNYQSIFLNAYENNRMAFPGVTYFIFVLFVLFMPILLMNLMIGLAVGDIAEVQRNAELKRIAMQIDLHTALEEKLPYWFLKRVDKPSITIYPNKCKKVLMQALIDGEIQNTVRTRLNLCSRQGGPLERELHKQKNRLKTMSCLLEKQHNLLKLIIQKMEITSEADEYDGPHNPRALKQPTSSSSQKSKWVPLLQAIRTKK
ncbi:hypothetical protein cypCar_00041207, partial [Cyprinus carpio]